MEDKIITLSYDELFILLKEAYRHGYATYESVDAGLEPYDPKGYAGYVLDRKIREKIANEQKA